MSTEVKSVEVKLNPATVEMKSKILEALTVPANGQIAGMDSIYESLLPEDLPVDLVRRLSTHNELFFAAAVDATGDAARSAAHTNAELKHVNVSFPMTGKDRFDIQWDHSAERNAGIAPKGEVAPKKTVYGVMSAKLTVSGTDTSVGELNKVIKRQKQAAHDLFGAVVTA